MTIIASLNTWSGGHEDFREYIKDLTHTSSIVCYQEVHDALQPMPSLYHPVDKGSRVFPMRPNLRREVSELHGSDWLPIYAYHIVGSHDCEPDERLRFGQLTLINTKVWEVIANKSTYVHGTTMQFNEELQGGEPCSKVAIATLVRHRASGTCLIITNVHGTWSRFGKRDMPARYRQNAGINQLIRSVQRLEEAKEALVVVIGDLNYTSRMMALYDLAHQVCFGTGGGVILNHRFGITDTRTSYYEKPVREADFAVVCRRTDLLTDSFRVDQTAPSDHATLLLTLRL